MSAPPERRQLVEHTPAPAFKRERGGKVVDRAEVVRDGAAWDYELQLAQNMRRPARRGHREVESKSTSPVGT